MEKAAKIVEPSDPEKAIGIYFKAAETVGLEDEPRKAIDHMARAARLQVKIILKKTTIAKGIVLSGLFFIETKLFNALTYHIKFIGSLQKIR